MAFPDDVLTESEEVVLHLRPHARVAVRPVLVLVLALGVTMMSWVMLPATSGGLIGVLLVGSIMLFVAVTSGVRPLLVWRCTHWVITDERILMQDGVIARERRDLPLNRINDHAVRQSPVDRVLGSGTLTVDSIGDRAAVLRSVPHAHQVQTTLYQLIEHDRELHGDEDEPEEEPAERPGTAPRFAFRRRAPG